MLDAICHLCRPWVDIDEAKHSEFGSYSYASLILARHYIIKAITPFSCFSNGGKRENLLPHEMRTFAL